MPDKHLKLPTKKKATRTPQKPPKVTTTSSPNIPNVDKDDSSLPTYVQSAEFPDVTEPDLDYDVDVLDDKQVWKPVLVFENKTQTTTTESSVIMKINKKKTDVDLFNIQAAPFVGGKCVSWNCLNFKLLLNCLSASIIVLRLSEVEVSSFLFIGLIDVLSA